MAVKIMTDPRVHSVEWRDLVPVTTAEIIKELTLVFPWLIGSNLNLLREAERAGVGYFTYVFTFHTPNLKRFDFVRGHERVADALKQSALNWSVVRPTGYFSAMEEVLLVASLGLLPEHAGGIARTNPIHEADLAPICVDALFDGIQER